MTPYYDHAGCTIYHGDCREVLPELEPVDLVFTSPPYDRQRNYGASSSVDWYDMMCGAFAGLSVVDDGQVLVNLGMVHRDGEWIPYWDGWIDWMRGEGWRRFGWYVWDQGHGLPGDWNGRFAPSHEFVFHFNRKARRPNKTVSTVIRGKISSTSSFVVNSKGQRSTMTGAGGERGTVKIPDSVIRCRRFHNFKDPCVDHPAMMPTCFVERLIAAFTDAGETVLDPFMGSGTTLRAAKDLGRKAIGIEIEEKYCEIAVKRLEQEVFEFEPEIVAV